MAFQNMALNMLILADKTCSDRPYFAPDFISHTELLLLNQCSREIFGMLDADDMMVALAFRYLEG